MSPSRHGLRRAPKRLDFEKVSFANVDVKSAEKPVVRGTLYLVLACFLALHGCGEDSKPSGTAADGDAGRGRLVYLAQCTACHAIDPAKDGPVGPAVKGSSRALLEAKVLRGSYPPGYTPKRNTVVMPQQPQLGPAIPDLDAFLR